MVGRGLIDKGTKDKKRPGRPGQTCCVTVDYGRLGKGRVCIVGSGWRVDRRTEHRGAPSKFPFPQSCGQSSQYARLVSLDSQALPRYSSSPNALRGGRGQGVAGPANHVAMRPMLLPCSVNSIGRQGGSGPTILVSFFDFRLSTGARPTAHRPACPSQSPHSSTTTLQPCPQQLQSNSTL